MLPVSFLNLFRLAFGLALALSAVAAVACGDDDEATNTGRSGAQTVDVTAKDFSFVPGKFTVEEGKEFQLRFKNSGTVAHTFTMDDFDVDAELSPGSTEAVLTATPPRAGQFTYYCRFHRGQGMQGTLTVGAEAAGGSEATTDVPTGDGVEGY